MGDQFPTIRGELKTRYMSANPNTKRLKKDPLKRLRTDITAFALKSSGVIRRRLVEMTGLEEDTISRVVRGRIGSFRARRKLEAAFILEGEFLPLWSDPEDYRQRMPMVEFFGCDIEAESLTSLNRLRQERGISTRRFERRADAIRAFTNFFHQHRETENHKNGSRRNCGCSAKAK